MSTLFDRIQGDLVQARKSRDADRTLLLGTVLSELKNRQFELRRDLTDDDAVDVLRKAIKRRREAAEMYVKGGRAELAEKERAEAAALEGYLPAAAGEDEIRAAVREAIAGGAANVGAVMGKVMPRFKGRAEGNAINAIAREELARQG